MWVYEDDFMIVKKVLGDIKTNSQNHVKRIQLVTWKNKNSDLLELDMRRYSIKEDKYSKGISFTGIEIRDLLKILQENSDEIKEHI